MDLGVCDAGWVSMSGELHLSCGALSLLLVTQSVTYFLRLTLRLQLCCKCVRALFVFSVTSGLILVGLLRQPASVVVKVCDIAANLQARISDVAAAARGCRFVVSTTSQSGFGARTRGFPRRKDKLCRGSKGRKGVASIRRKRTRKCIRKIPKAAGVRD